MFTWSRSILQHILERIYFLHYGRIYIIFFCFLIFMGLNSSLNAEKSNSIELDPVLLNKGTGNFSGRLVEIGNDHELLRLNIKPPLPTVLFSKIPEKYSVPAGLANQKIIKQNKIVIQSVPTEMLADHSTSSDHTLIVLLFSIPAGLALGVYLVKYTRIRYFVSLRGKGTSTKGLIYYFLCVCIILLPLDFFTRGSMYHNCYIDNATSSDYEIIINSDSKFTIPSMKYILIDLKTGKTNIKLIRKKGNITNDYTINIPKTAAERNYLYNISKANTYNIVAVKYTN